MIPKHAFVREPGASYRKCISSHPLLNMLNISLAREQHGAYCKALEDLGLEIILLPRDDHHPDSCFVEDTAIIHNKKALISRMGAVSRRGEVETVAEVLSDYLDIKYATVPAMIEGGDVIHLPNRFISGVTMRTNEEGVLQASSWLEVEVDTIVDHSIVHLKSHVTYLGNNVVIATPKYAKHPVLRDYQVLSVPEGENYAANTLTIGDTVFMANSYPRTRKLVIEAGFDVLSLDMSEFQKCEGALTCLSLLF